MKSYKQLDVDKALWQRALKKLLIFFFHQCALNLIRIKSTHVEHFFKVLYVTY